jgi:putative nucleotidyltransferase with HDIG domain
VYKINKNLAILISSSIIILATFFIIYYVKYSQQTYIEQSQKMLYQEAQAHFQNMVNTRSWNAKFSGVFVLPEEQIKPNPYLKDNHMFAKDGTMLVRVNPAWMTRQISEIANTNGDYFFKITSLMPINPNNKADAFEQEALKSFEKNGADLFYTKFDQDYYNFMGALKVQKACLYCHAEQGYKEGDIRGGLRVSIPLQSYHQSTALIKEQSQTLITFILFIGVLVLIMTLYFIFVIYKRQNTIENLNITLEQKVKERTQTLENLYEHEKYLKGILGIIAQVNETLITSYSIHSIAKTCIDQLTFNRHYGNLWIGFIKADEKIDILAKSKDMQTLFSKESYEITMHTPQEIVDIYNIHQSHNTIIQPIDHKNLLSRRKGDFSAKWNIAIPIKYSTSEYICGFLSLSTDKAEGFLPEEINMLENIVNDITLSMQMHIQDNILKQMETDKIENYENTILAFVNIIEQRDTYTAGHTIRVAEYCRLIASYLKIEESQIKKLEKAAILHDIGKVATPDAILLKPGKLSKLEYELIKHHAKAGYEMLSKINMYEELANIVKYHHSRYDGEGYPKTGSPDEIPFLSHIMIVADAFDAMTTNRIYKPRLTIQEALNELQKCSSKQFHPQVVEAALEVFTHITIENNTQLPSSELEKKRFSYFFQDSLTSLYNENYLQIELTNKSNAKSNIYHIELHRFSAYNKEMGWESGNQLLKDIAKNLSKTFPNEQIFRFHGDDFIIITKEKIPPSFILDILDKNIANTLINADVFGYKLDKLFSIEDLK